MFAVKNSGISCLVLIFDLTNQTKTILYEKNLVQGCNVKRGIYHFFSLSMQTQGVVAKVSLDESGYMAFIPAGH